MKFLLQARSPADSVEKITTDSVEKITDEVVQPIDQFLSHPLVGQAIEVLIGVILIGLFFRLINSSVPRYIRDGELRYRFRKTLSFISYALMIIYGVSVFSNSISQLTVILGATGAGIAFALQEVIASLAGWTALSFGQFYKPGDRVQLGGITGDVIDVSILRTTLMECGGWVKGDLYNGRIVRVANSFVFKEPVYNYSGDFPFLWDEVTIPVTYGGDHHLAREILVRVTNEVAGDYIPQAEAKWGRMVEKYRIEDAQVQPMVTLVTNDNWMEFTIRYVVDYKIRRRIKDQLFTRILDEFMKTDGRVSFASATFHLVDAPTFNVKLHHDN
ncbi:MAG: mechanosensitive ion channel [Symploca sp. SIO2G7]|nr:mechanosensitive ion channel [Symploca sp. SIO2G7]